jgi:hypothetical protein
VNPNLINQIELNPQINENNPKYKNMRLKSKIAAKVKKIRSDNGTEFKNTQVEDFLDEEDIKHEFLAPYTPQ